MATVTGVLNSNVDKANGVGMVLTSEKQITLIVTNRTGAKNNYIILLEGSGGNTSEGVFTDVPESAVIVAGIKTIHHNFGYVKAKVVKPEGAASEVNVTIIAR